MIQINASQVTPTLKALFDQPMPAGMRCFTVLAGSIVGDILTDDAQAPTWGVVRETAFGTTYFAGVFDAQRMSDIIALLPEDVLALGTYRLQPSPDGRYILWILYGGEGVTWLVIDTVTGEVQRFESNYYVASWSPDSTQFALIDAEYIQLYDVAGASRVNLSAGTDDVAWSPDGTRLATVRTDPDTRLSQVIVMNVDGTDPVEIFPPITLVVQITWSPDGKYLALNMADPNLPTNSFEYLLALVNIETREYRYISGEHRRPAHMLWSPDSEHLAFFEAEAQHVHLYGINLVEDEITTLAEVVAPCNAPIWRP